MVLSRKVRAFRERAQHATVRFWEPFLGIAGGALAAVLTWHGDLSANDVRPLIIAEASLGAGLTAAVVTAIAILTALVDDVYRMVLTQIGGVRRALMPFLIVAALSALTAVISLFALLLLPPASENLVVPAVAICSGLAVWSLAGVVSLVELVIFHAAQRAALLDGIEEATRVRNQRRRETDSE